MEQSSQRGVESLLLRVFQARESGIRMESLHDLCDEERLWALLSDIDESYFSPMLFPQFEFSFDTIVRLMVDYAWEKCKVAVSSRYSCTLIRQRNPEEVGAFALFLAVHSDKRQCFVEKILELPTDMQKDAMQIIEDAREQIMENDKAEVLAKVGLLQSQLEQEIKKVAERDEEISKLSSQLQTVFSINKELKKRVAFLEEDQQQAMQELNVTNFEDLILQHNEIRKEREESQQQATHRKEEFEALKDRYSLALSRIEDLEEELADLKESLQNESRNRESLTNVLQDTQDSYIFKEVARLSVKQDSMRMEMILAKKASVKDRQRVEQKQEQLGELYKHLKQFEKKVKKIKTERHPELDSMIRSSRCNIG